MISSQQTVGCFSLFLPLSSIDWAHWGFLEDEGWKISFHIFIVGAVYAAQPHLSPDTLWEAGKLGIRLFSQVLRFCPP